MYVDPFTIPFFNYCFVPLILLFVFGTPIWIGIKLKKQGEPEPFKLAFGIWALFWICAIIVFSIATG